MNTKAHILESIHKSCIQMLLQEAFYGRIMMQLPKVIDEHATQASIQRWKAQVLSFIVSPQFWQSLNDTQRLNLIKRVVLELIFKHSFFPESGSSEALYKMALQACVTPYLNPVTTTEEVTFTKLTNLAKHYQIDFLPQQMLAYYYQQLEKLNHAIIQNPTATLPSELTKLRANLDFSNKSKIIFPQDSNPATQKILAYQVETLLQKSLLQLSTAEKNNSNFPLTLIEKLVRQNLVQKSTINWKRQLQLFASSSRKTILSNTIHRPSKRYNTTPGLKIKRRQIIWIAIDTSGSIQQEDFDVFFREINQIWRRGADVFLLECDTAIQKKYHYQGQAPKVIHGRGATNFTPVLTLANEQAQLDALLYFTDGDGLPPSINSRYPLLWVISKNGITADHHFWKKLPSKKIKIHF
ncbi:MAG: VWA-like domain-containing protein [Saprospiraceae bacterium]